MITSTATSLCQTIRNIPVIRNKKMVPISSKEDKGSLENKAKKNKKQIDCRKIRTTRSRIKRTICLTELEWQRIEESSQLLSRELYSS